MAALPHVENALAAYGKSISELRAIVAGPTIEVSEIRQTEIRSKLSGLPAAKRVAAIARSIERGDDSVVASVLNVDRLMSDFLSDVEFDTVRTFWALARHPDEVALLTQRESDVAHLERAAGVVQSWQRQTHNPAVVAAGTQAGGLNVRGAPGPAPSDRSRALGIAGIAERAAAFRAAHG